MNCSPLPTNSIATSPRWLNNSRWNRPERKGKSPRELLTGQKHPHWLELRDRGALVCGFITKRLAGTLLRHGEGHA
jgi:hypothetical protein